MMCSHYKKNKLWLRKHFFRITRKKKILCQWWALLTDLSKWWMDSSLTQLLQQHCSIGHPTAQGWDCLYLDETQPNLPFMRHWERIKWLCVYHTLSSAACYAETDSLCPFASRLLWRHSTVTTQLQPQCSLGAPCRRPHLFTQDTATYPRLCLLTKLTAKNDMEVFLGTFKRAATRKGWPRREWEKMPFLNGGSAGPLCHCMGRPHI